LSISTSKPTAGVLPGRRSIFRQIEVASANGKTHSLACREEKITEETFYCWRKEYGGMKTDQAKRLKELEQENSKPKRLVAQTPALLRCGESERNLQ
jgi:hypothetical protein